MDACVYKTFSKFHGYLSFVFKIVSHDITNNNRKRQEWFSWHSDWKKAWLECEVNKDISIDELNAFRENTSITKKMRCLEEDF